jgi:hypothetical protein
VKQNNWLRMGGAAALATVTTCGWLALAPPAFAHTTAPRPTRHVTAVHPAGYLDCVQWLDSVDYPVTPARAAACAIGALGLPNTAAAIAACNVALLVTKVDPGNAFFACTLAATPN